MAKFVYNNANTASTGHTPFELNCGYRFWMSYKEDIKLRFKFKSAEDWLAQLLELMTICHENFHHTQKLQKKAHNKGVKPRSYTPSDKVWMNSKYIKTK